MLFKPFLFIEWLTKQFFFKFPKSSIFILTRFAQPKSLESFGDKLVTDNSRTFLFKSNYYFS